MPKTGKAGKAGKESKVRRLQAELEFADRHEEQQRKCLTEAFQENARLRSRLLEVETRLRAYAHLASVLGQLESKP